MTHFHDIVMLNTCMYSDGGNISLLPGHKEVIYCHFHSTIRSQQHTIQHEHDIVPLCTVFMAVTASQTEQLTIKTLMYATSRCSYIIKITPTILWSIKASTS